ncbi:hypothetical protein NTH44_003360 [Vibrio metoecus]|nr:hypothetical protein [Vibrio cholerae]
MTIPVCIRNEIAYRKLVLIAQNTFINTSSTKLWTTHVHDFDPSELDFNALKNKLTKFLISDISVMPIINEIHINTPGVILEDKGITILFIDRVTEVLNGY